MRWSPPSPAEAIGLSQCACENDGWAAPPNICMTNAHPSPRLWFAYLALAVTLSRNALAHELGLFSVWSSLDRVANSFGARPLRLVWGRA